MHTEKELYPGHAEELRRHGERVAAATRASAEPFPGPLLAAFAHIPEEIAGLKIRPLVHYDFIILRQLDSPLLKQMQRREPEASTPSPGGEGRGEGGLAPASSASAPAVAYTDEQAYEMIFQFTRPVKEVARRCSVEPAARSAFRQHCIEEIGMTLGPVEVGLLVAAVEREFVRYFSTFVKYGPRELEADANGTQTFPAPPPTTASVGGSTTSAV